MAAAASSPSRPQPYYPMEILGSQPYVPLYARPVSLILRQWGMVPHPLALGRFGSVGLGIRA